MIFFKEYILDFIKNNIFYLITLILELTIIVILIVQIINKDNPMEENNLDTVQENIVENNLMNESIEELDVIVDIKGAVKNPGVYKLHPKTIINDAISTAGGLTKKASTININLGAEVTDRMVIYVANKEELTKSINTKTNNVVVESKVENDMNISNDAKIDNSKSVGIEIKGDTKKTNDEVIEQEEKKINDLISINKATKEELTELPSIGEAKALKIISYREENGLFKSIEEIKNVSGIGDALFEKIKDYISI